MRSFGMKDYFKFLEELKVGDEVLTTTSTDRIYTVSGVLAKKIAISNGFIYDKGTGELVSNKKKEAFSALRELTPENKARIEAEAKTRQAKEEKDRAKEQIQNEFDDLVGKSYRSKSPSIEVQKKVIEFIKSF